jgi:16S rRNA (adenine1518-N6/adenine1519-N6)-dimethyltransferase
MQSPPELLRARGLRPKKSWGQNFLADPWLLAELAAASGAGPEDDVVELGAGLGHLTEALLRTGARVVAVERDRDLADSLRASFGSQPRLTVLEANAATLSIPSLGLRAPPVVVGNLPYHLSSVILFQFLAQRGALRGMLFTLQDELAARLAAQPGSRTYGVLSVLAQAAARVEAVLALPASAFYPVPKVASAAVRIDPLPVPRASLADDPRFATAVRAAFAQRRKTLANSLRGAGYAEPEAVLERLGIDPRRRAETLSVEDFDRLASALDPIKNPLRRR